MPKNPDIQYIRVRHLGKNKGSLLIEDLDTESNKKQPYQIPVYIPESGFVDLPMNDQVLLSFNQGTLRSFIEQGFVSGFVVSDDGSAEVWVSPNGSDDNPGTRNSPYKTITAATNYVQDNFPDDTIKTVRVLQGEYNDEEIVIHKRFVRIIGESRNFFDQRVYVSLANQGPALSITNMTPESWQSFVNDGGVDYTDDGTTFAYTGAQVTGRDTTYRFQATVVIENIIFRQDPGDATAKPPVVVLGSDFDGNAASMNTITFDKVGFYQFVNQDRAAIYIKNARPIFNGCTVVSTMVCDNADKLTFRETDSESATIISNNLILRQGGGDPALEGIITNGQTFAANSHLYGLPVDLLRVYKESGNHELHTTRDEASVAVTGAIEIFGTVDLSVRSLSAQSLTVSGVSACNIGRLLVDQNVSLSGASIYNVDGGTIRGNLTLLDGAGANFTGLVVKGDVDLTNADPSNFTWRGGSFYGTKTDPQNILGAAVAGDYLNI